MGNDKVKVEITGDNSHLEKAFYSSEKVVKTSSKNMADAVGAAGVAMGAAFAAVGTVQFAAEIITLADSYTNLNSRLKLVTESSEQLIALQEDLFQLSQDTGTSYTTNAASYAKLALSLQSLNVSQEEMLGISELVNKSLIVSGASTDEISSFTLQFTQAMGSGVLQGEEFRAMMEANSYFGARLAKALDTDIAGLRKMSKAGKLTTDTLRKAFPKMADEISAAFDQMPLTVARAMNEMKNSFQQVVDEANTATGGTLDIAAAIEEIANKVIENKAEIIGFYEDVVEVTGSVYDITKKFEEYGGPSFGEWGVIGFALLRGGPQAAALTTAVVTLNTQLKAFDLNLGNLATSGKDFYDTMGRLINGEHSSYFDEAGNYIGSADDKLGELNEDLEYYRRKLTEIESLEGWRKVLNDMAGGAEDTEFLKNKISALLGEIGALEGAGVGATDMFMGLAAANERVGVIAVESAKDAVAGEKEVVKAIRITTDERYTALQISKDAANQAEKERNRESIAAKKHAADKASAYRDMFGDMEHSSQESFDHQLGLLNLQKEEYEALKLDQLKIDEWYNAEVSDLEDERLLKAGDFFDGMRLGYEQLLDDQITWAEAGKDIFNTFADESADALSSNLFDVIHGDFDNLGDAWGDLWDAMLKKLSDVLAEMAVSWVASQIGSAFDGWDISTFHTGLWEVKSDEIPAILQEGEMVIPREHADFLRDEVGGQGFDGLYDAYDSDHGYGAFGGMFGSNLGDEYTMSMLEAMAAITGGMPANTAIAGVLSPFTAVDNVADALAQTGLDAMHITGTYADVGSFIGSTLSQVGFGFTGVLGSLTGALGNFAGGYIGDLIGDALDDREFEQMRDMFETGTPSQRDGLFGFLEEMSTLGLSSSQEFTDFFSAMGTGYPPAYTPVSSEAADMADAQSQVEAAHGGVGFDVTNPQSFADPIGYNIDIGTTADDSYGAGYEVGPGNDAPYGTQAGGLGGVTGDGDEFRDGGIATGPGSGYPATLHGTEAIVPLPNGRSIPVEMQGADREGEAALLAEIKALRADLRIANYQIAKNTNAFARVLKRWDGDGMPEARVLN
jgi:tape measure domain-containing protein